MRDRGLGEATYNGGHAAATRVHVGRRLRCALTFFARVSELQGMARQESCKRRFEANL